MENEIKILTDFVEGVISPEVLEKYIFENSNFEELLSDKTINLQGTYLARTNVYFFLMELNLKSLDGVLNAQGALELFLTRKGINFKASKKYKDEYSLILSTQPKYIDADMNFIEKYILPNDMTKSKLELKKHIKENFSRLFMYETKPPKWIQNAEWIIKNNKPLFFLGQLDIKNNDIFHDDGAVYIFIDQETGQIETITQLY